MIRMLFKYGVMALLLILIQVLVLNNFQYSIYVNPYLYVLVILLLPVDMNNQLLLTLGFFLGLSIDLFTSTYGMHASATVFLCFLRPFILTILSPRDGYEVNEVPHFQSQGYYWFIVYSGALILAHHLFLFFVEAFRFAPFWQIMGRVFSSSFVTLVLVIIAMLLTTKPEKRS